jgi:moderate conductance mechanosensitive channel
MEKDLTNFVDTFKILPDNAPGIAKIAVNWALAHGIKVFIILAGMWIIILAAKAVGRKIIKITEDEDPTTDNDRERRTKTLVQIFNIGVKTLVISFGAISILKEIGFDIGPILAGAGIIGLAIGFGSQSLVRDIVSGFFMILENQLRVGDVAQIGGVAGLVEKITLRIVVLRDLDGVVHTIPNGEIKTISNMTYGWSRAKLDFGVAYKENIDEVIEILQRLGNELVEDEQYKAAILEGPVMLGVDSLDDSAVTVRMLFKTVPLKQWDIAREFKRRVKNEFDKLGIEIPFPHRTVYIGNSQNRDS